MWLRQTANAICRYARTYLSQGTLGPLERAVGRVVAQLLHEKPCRLNVRIRVCTPSGAANPLIERPIAGPVAAVSKSLRDPRDRRGTVVLGQSIANCRDRVAPVSRRNPITAAERLVDRIGLDCSAIRPDNHWVPLGQRPVLMINGRALGCRLKVGGCW